MINSTVVSVMKMKYTKWALLVSLGWVVRVFQMVEQTVNLKIFCPKNITKKLESVYDLA